MTSNLDSREAERREFLHEAGWGEAQRDNLAGDASTRRYERLQTASGERAVLMDAPPAAEAPSCPPDATPEERRALGYNALACLAGPDARPFMAISRFLVENGFSAPKVLSADLERGLLLLEDLGDDLFARIVNKSASEDEIYKAAVDLLADLHTLPIPQSLPVNQTSDYILHHYDRHALGIETDLLIEWFAPAALKNLTNQARSDYQGAWQSLFDVLEGSDAVLVLRDYHAENLLWLPQRTGRARVGLLDFQDGLLGHRAYDLVSLLQDARRDVDPELEKRMIEHYCSCAMERSSGFNEAEFHRAYAILGVQRNAKIIGIFVRLAKRDGKPKYLGFLPRIWAYIERGLAHEDLRNIAAWFEKNVPADARGALDENAL